MKIDKNYTIRKHAEKVRKLFQEKVGEGIYPSNKEVAEFWDAVSNPLPPRTYMYIFQIKEDITYRSKGLSLLGLPDAFLFSSDKILGITHVNQRQLVVFQTLRLHETFINHPELIRDKGVVYCTSRGVQNFAEKDSYFLVHQIGYPVQYDANGHVTKYFSSYRILGDYKGEALATEVFTDPQYPNEQAALREILSQIKQDMLAALKFTKTEQRIIEQFGIDVNLTAKQIAEIEASEVKTIRNHFNSINRKAKEAFPLNDFQNVKDIVKYLKQQLII